MADPASPPPLRSLITGADRRAAWQYWLRDPAIGLSAKAAHHAVRAMPLDTPWVLGKRMGDILRRAYPRAEKRMRNNWAWLRPNDKDPALIDAAVATAFRNAATAYFEYSVLDRLWDAGRITYSGGEHCFAARDAGRPLLVVCLHTGNWEILGVVGWGAKYGVTAVYRPAQNRFLHNLLVSSRKRYDMTLVTPDAAGARAAMRALMGKKNLLGIYIDEYIDGRVAAPSFGRPIRDDDNIAYAARLAAMADAVVVPAYCLRLDGVRFHATFMPPVPMARTGDREADIRTNVQRIDAVIAPVVKQHLDQWLPALYMRRKA